MRTAIASSPEAGVVADRASSMDAGLLLLRVGAGVSLLLLFGIPKLRDALHSITTGQLWLFVEFNRKLGLPFPTSVAYCQTLNESVGALSVAAGLLSRVASGTLAFGFAVAAYCSIRVHENSSMLAAGYCLMFATLLLTGPGKFSIDHMLKLHKRQGALISQSRGAQDRCAVSNGYC